VVVFSFRNGTEQNHIPDDSVLLALDLGFALGLDSRLKRLTERAVQLTRAGKVKGELLSVEEVISRQQEYVQSLDNARAS
jgi:hypothetical protein